MEPIRSEYEDDPDMMEIVTEFAAELKDRVTTLQETYESGDFEALRVLAHQLKGAGGGYGFPKITEDAALLESCLKDAEVAEQVKASLEQLCQTLSAVVLPEGS